MLPSRDDAGRDLGVLDIAATLPQTIAPAVAALYPAGIVIALVGAGAVLPSRAVR